MHACMLGVCMFAPSLCVRPRIVQNHVCRERARRYPHLFVYTEVKTEDDCELQDRFSRVSQGRPSSESLLAILPMWRNG